MNISFPFLSGNSKYHRLLLHTTYKPYLCQTDLAYPTAAILLSFSIVCWYNGSFRSGSKTGQLFFFFFCPILVPLSPIRPSVWFPLKKCMHFMFSSPPYIIPCVSDLGIMALTTSVCQLQCPGVTHSANSLILHLVFSESLLMPIPFHFITLPHQLL